MTDQATDAPEREQILADLAAVASTLSQVEATRTSLYARRLALWQQARNLVPPITQRELAATSGVTEPLVIQNLRKARNAATDA